MNAVYAIIDTETNGLFDFKLPADAEGQARLAHLAIILADTDMNEVGAIDYLIRPDGWEMTPDATAINGLTTEHLMAEGAPVAVALDAYASLIEQGYAVIAFNAQYDTKVMRGEFRRGGRDDLFAKTRNTCAMRGAMSLKVKNEGGKGFPKLEHVCRHFGIPVEPKPHNAVYGARACFEVVRQLRQGGGLPEPSVHLAKTRPGEALPAAESTS